MTPRLELTATVGVNLMWLVPGVVGGSEEYTVGLLHALADEFDRSGIDHGQITVFVNRRFPQVHGRLCERLPTVVAPLNGQSKTARVVGESSWLAAGTKRRHLDVVHHMGGLVPFVAPGRTVLTLHDLQPLVFPEHFGPLKRRFHQHALPSSLRRAHRIVTLSRYTRDQLVTHFDIPVEHIVVLRPGITLPSPRVDEEATVAEVRTRFGLSADPYFLYPAITYPHKNHGVLLEALAGVGGPHRRARLVLTGGEASSEQALNEAVQRLGLGDRIVRPGRIPASQLEALYRGATALLFPSRFEGFGLPVLEAMRVGCPVLAASATALPEVVGGAGMLLSPDDPEEWTEAMVSMLDDDEARAALIEAGRSHAREFAWAPSARRLVELYQESATS